MVRPLRIVMLAMLFLGIVSAFFQSNSTPAQPTKTDDPKEKPEKAAPPKVDPLDEEILRRGKLTSDPDALLEFFHKRTLPEKERPEIERQVKRLGSMSFVVRERASLTLIERGVAVGEILRAEIAGADLELKRRIESCLAKIQENDVPAEVPGAAVRVLALKKPAKMNEALIGYVPFADGEAPIEGIRLALLGNALVEGKADPVLVAALADRAPSRRAMAGEVLGRAAFAETKAALQKLLADPDAYVRFRVARALVFARQADAVAVVIDGLADLPANTAWQAEDFLLQIGAGASPPSVPLGTENDSRAKSRDTWRDWWKKNQNKVDLAKLEDAPKMLGRTLVVLLDQNRVMELNPDNSTRIDFKNITFPLDAQLLDDDRVLVAEYHANRVTERNKNGEILWTRNVATPIVAQRLPNGNTFVATPHGLHEFNKDNQDTLNVTLSDGNQFVMKAMKLPNGEIVCMCADSRIVRYDAKGKELSSFTITLGMRLFGGRIHVLPSGRILVPHNAENKVIEYDAKGKIVWEVAAEQPIAAMRLPNGNTLITSMNPRVGAVEVNRAGASVWSYQDPGNTRVTRAIRR